MRTLALIFIIALTTITVSAQNQFRHFREAAEIRYSATQPVIHYILRVDPTDYSSFRVEMRIQNIPDTFRVAMVTHPEYDDKFWRYVNDLEVSTANGEGKVIRLDSTIWKVFVSGGRAILKYRIQLPKLEDFSGAWIPFLNSTGVLFGGPHSFMYVVGQSLAPSHITLQLPKGWTVNTGLVPTSDPKTFFAPTTMALIDAPIFAGNLKRWQFAVDGVPHTVTYYPTAKSVSFDTITLVSTIEKFVRQASALFGRLPYRDYSFQLRDGSWGGLEHMNSVTLGAPSDRLSKGFTDFIEELGHEYFHSWNLMRIHPIEYGDVNYVKPPLSKGLWFSEGLTIFYADLLSRRAGLPVEDSTRISHLRKLLLRYFNSAGNREISPEKVSYASYGPEGMLGDYSGSSHLQGELLANLFDLIIRDATSGARSMDDAMQRMMEKFSGEKGFESKDIEVVLKEISGRDFHQFFEDHVRGNKLIDFNKYLGLIGMKMNISLTDATNEEGKKIPDSRVYPYQHDGEKAIRFATTDPQSVWAKAGLHTGDILKSVNDKPITTEREFFETIRSLKIGDRVVIEVEKPTGPKKIPVVIVGYKRTMVEISEISGASERQKNLLRSWESGLK